MIIPTTCWILVSSVASVSHWGLAVSWELQTLLTTGTKDGLLIKSTAVPSVKKKSVSEGADCFPLSSPTWQSFWNGGRVVFPRHDVVKEKDHHCCNFDAGLGHSQASRSPWLMVRPHSPEKKGGWTEFGMIQRIRALVTLEGKMAYYQDKQHLGKRGWTTLEGEIQINREISTRSNT